MIPKPNIRTHLKHQVDQSTGAYQGLLVGTLAVLRILDVNSLTAYAILVQLMQIFFWLIVGIWVLSKTKVNLLDLIRRSEEVESDPE